MSMKRIKSGGRSARRGNSPSPYHKYHKRPYKYGAAVDDVYRRARRVGGQTQKEEQPRG